MYKINISANFTSEPILDSLNFWVEFLGIEDCKIDFAPYNQVLQSLLDPVSLLSVNQVGVNVLMIRLVDWLRECDDADPSQSEILKRTTGDLISAAKKFQTGRVMPLIVFLDSRTVGNVCGIFDENILNQAEDQIKNLLDRYNNITVYTWKDLNKLYPVSDWYDAKGDSEGHIPYTSECFVALGTFIARTVDRMRRRPFKVIVLDCDNTLWRGVCGEEEPERLKVDESLKIFHELLVEQRRNGRLLCLCSKNSEADVLSVFSSRTDFPLKWEDFTSWRINWQPKSQNLVELAGELNVGIDSFIFIDDNPAECAEVRSNCPEALVLELPGSSMGVELFLQHVWPLDQEGITIEDRRRSEMYREARQRNEFQKKVLSFSDFIAGLNLTVDIHPVEEDEIERVAQLTERTNQFNFTTIRRSVYEVRELLDSGSDVQVLNVNDRFGNYGLVGVLISREIGDTLVVDTFLLSCRVLGRGVEHRAVSELGLLADKRGLAFVELNYSRTAKNEPARIFLESVAKPYLKRTRDGVSCRIPTSVASSITFEPNESIPLKSAKPDSPSDVPQTSGRDSDRCSLDNYSRIANELNDPKVILKQIASGNVSLRPKLSAPYVAPRNSVEQTLADIWREVLRVDRVGVQDDFFKMGGDSILSIQIISKASQKGLQLTLRQQFQNPTIESLAKAIDESESSFTTAPQNAVGGIAPLTAIQEWFFEKGLPDPNHWNMEMMLEVRQAIDPDLLDQALHRIVEHHDALRMRFKSEASGWFQINQKLEQGTLLWIRDLSNVPPCNRDSEIRRAATEAHESLNLAQGPLLRAVWFQSSDLGNSKLLIAVHHLVCDGITWRILLEDLQSVYLQLCEENAVSLPTKTNSYLQWAESVNRYARDQTSFVRELDYWVNDRQRAVSSLPVDYPDQRDMGTEETSRIASTILDAVDTQKLLAEVPRAYQTQINDALLVAFVKTLNEWSGESIFFVDLEGHGRESILPELNLSRTVGWFTSVFPVFIEYQPANDLGRNLLFVREQLRQLPNRGIGYGLLRYLSDNSSVVERLRNQPQPELMFNYLGQFDQVMPGGGLFRSISSGSGAPLRGGKGRRQHLLEIIGGVENGELKLDWIYSTQVYESTTIENLARRFGENLRDLICFCENQSPIEESASPEYPLAMLNSKSLDRVLSQFAKSKAQ